MTSSSAMTERLASVKAPALVIDSAGSFGGLGRSARAVADAHREGRRQTLKGEHHKLRRGGWTATVTSFFLDPEL